MSEILSEEQLAVLLAKAERVPRRDGVKVTALDSDAEHVASVYALILAAQPDVIANLVREVQAARAQRLTPDELAAIQRVAEVERLTREAEALKADNAALRAALLGIEHVEDDEDGRNYCPECIVARPSHDDDCKLGHALHGAPSPGAALLAELESLRAQVAAEREACAKVADAMGARLRELADKADADGQLGFATEKRGQADTVAELARRIRSRT